MAGGVYITLNNINLLIGGVMITKPLFGKSHVPGDWTGLEATRGSSNSKNVHNEWWRCLPTPSYTSCSAASIYSYLLQL